MVFAIDFDGTLVSNKYPAIGVPNWRLVNKAKELQAAGHELILWSCRVGEHLQEAIQFCDKELDLRFNYINESSKVQLEKYGYLNPRKVGADYYVDDKNLSLSDFIDMKM